MIRSLQSIPDFLGKSICSVILSVLMLTNSNILHAQGAGKIIRGKVLAVSTKDGIPGVNVVVKGTTNGTMSDVEGNYSLSVPNDATLIFSSIGYITEEIIVGDQTVINLSMSDDVTSLEEVVIVGYGEQKRSNVTGALSVVKVADLENKTQFRMDQALQGMAAGVNVTRNGGAPGSAPTIHVRGVGSIGNTAPLWIIDGIRMDPGNSFDVNDVESMEVLKDASASAIYGVQAANGVILVKTKRGKKNGLQVNFKTSLGQRQAFKLPLLLNSADYVKFKKEGRLNAGQNPEPGWDNYSADTDWIKAFYNGTGAIQSNSVSIAKGDEKINYFFSFGNDNEQGILIDNSYKRYSVRLNSDVVLAKWLKAGEALIISKVLENPISNNNESYTGGIPYRSAPTMPIYDPTNTFGGWGRGEAYFLGPNPVATQYQQHEKRTSNRLDGSLFVEATPLKGFMVRSTLGLNYYGYLVQQFNEAFDYGYFSNHIAQLTYGSSTSESITANVVATYEKKISEHNFKLMGGYESWQYDGRHFNVVGYGFPIPVASSLNLTTGSLTSTDRASVSQDRLLSQFGRFNYNYKDKYLLEANVRRDGSSKFVKGNQWGVFPSFSAGWKISSEEFFQNLKTISSLKVRGSIGKLGYTGGIGNFAYQSPYTSQFSTYSYSPDGTKVPGYYLSRFSNKAISWEESLMTDIAIEVGFLQNKFTLSVDLYRKDTKGLLVPVPVPGSIGISTHNFDAVSPVFNVGTLRNTGIDIDFGYNTAFRKFNVAVNGNTSLMKNKMLSLFGQYITGGDGGGQIGGMTRTYAGKPISSFYGYEVQQMLNTPSDIFAINTYPKDGIYQEVGTAPGDLMYRDLSGPGGKQDGKVTADYDRTIIGNPWPKMTYALNTTIVYNKIIDVSIQFQGVQGVDIFNANKAYSRNFFGDDNTTTLMFDAWTPEHHTNNPRNVANDPNGNFSKPSTYFIEDGSYLKLRNLQIGFNVPKSLLAKTNLTRVRLYANGNNLLTITKYSGTDPEIAGGNISRGVDYGVYPQVRTYSAGLEVQF